MGVRQASRLTSARNHASQELSASSDLRLCSLLLGGSREVIACLQSYRLKLAEARGGAPSCAWEGGARGIALDQTGV